MELADKVAYWYDIAQYDVKTAESMYKSGRYLYTVFMCQQGIEKILKALYLKKFSKEAPFSHNLVYLGSLLELNLKEADVKLMAELTSFYLEGRYPSYKSKLSRLIKEKKAKEILGKSKEIFKWLKSRLK